MRHRLSVPMILLVGLLLAGAAQAAWIDQGSATPARPQISASGHDALVTLEFEIPGFDLSTVEIDGESYAKVLLPGFAPRMERGYPELPYLTASVAIPGRGRPEARLVDAEWDEIAIDPVRPSKGHFSRDIDPATVAHVFSDLYAKGGVWPETVVNAATPYIVRDLRGVSVHLNAFRYDADRGVLMVLRRAVVEVATSGSGENEFVGKDRAHDPEFQRVYRNLFANYGTEKYSTIAHPGNMLVVVDDALQGAIQPFVEWKLQKGIPVEVVPTSTIGATVSNIQSAITTRYESAAGLTYVVLVGDIAEIPTHTGTAEGNGSDATYAMVDGNDFYTDLFLSRISASNPTDVQTQINKFIRYERDPDTGAAADWYRKGMGLASNEGNPSDDERADAVRADLLGYGYTDVDQIYQPTGSSSDILNAINDGRSVGYYIGHGSGTSWSNPPFSNSNIPALDNGWMTPWIIDISCLNGTTSMNPCFAEAWMRAGTPTQPDGAVSMFSSWESCAWVPPTVMMDEVIDLYVAESTSTLGALYFYGCMKALDVYPGNGGEGHALVEQYTIFGDCSLEVRSQEPTYFSAAHMPVLHLGSPEFAVQVPGDAGAVCTLYRDGVLLGSAVADASGDAVIVLDTPVTTPGDVTLTVTGFNKVPHQSVLPAINPSVVTFSPNAIDAGVPTDVTVTVLGADGVTPVADVSVWALGLGYATTPVSTDANGQAVLALDYPFGPTLNIQGQESGAGFLLFDEPLTVNAAALAAPDLSVTTTFGMSDQFGLNLPGTLVATVAEPGATLFAQLPDGSVLDTGDATLELTPAETGVVTGMIAVAGYDVYSEAFDVIEAFGTVSGVVTSEGAPLAGAVVRATKAGAEVFSVTTAADGSYAVTEDVLVDTYDLEVTLFGYLTSDEPYFLGYGANVHDVALTAAPAGTLAGTVTEMGTGAPLAATVRAFRDDDGSLYAETVADGADGSYELTLPFFGYNIHVSASGHIPVQVAVEVDQPAITLDVEMEETNGNILVLDDGAKARTVAPKLDPKHGHVVEPGYTIVADRSAANFQSELVALGYAVTMESADASDPATWINYDLVVSSSGANNDPVASTALRNSLIAYVQAGGKLLIEGGEIAYDHQNEASFAAQVLHISDWNGDSSGGVTIADAGHALASSPNALSGPMALNYSGYGDADRVSVAADATMVGNWSNYSGNGSIVAYDPNPAPMGGQIVYFTFNLAELAAGGRTDLVQNAAIYLLMTEQGDASVSGRVTLGGLSDHSGVLVEALPGGGSVITGSEGTYSFEGLYAGEYTIRASKLQWSVDQAVVNLSSGQHLTDVNLTLGPVMEAQVCSQPGASIPDNDSSGVSDVILVALAPGVSVTELEVFVDIAHTYQGDLQVLLTSPAGTQVTLHSRSGGSAHDIYGWYPGELTPAETLDAYIGEDCAGEWTLTVSDHASYDTGTVNEWCLKLAYDDPSTGVGDEAPRVMALDANYPNPFNPATTIRFTVPQEGPVSLDVYDLSGRLVRSLVNDRLEADAYEVVWRGQDDAGRRVASGSYYYRLTAGGETAVRKMTLLK